VVILIIFIVIIGFMIIGVPIAFSFGAGALLLLFHFDIDAPWAVMQSLQLISAFTLLAAPLYVLLGTIIEKAGLAQRIIDVTNSILPRIRGVTGIAVIISNGFFGAMSGSAMSALGGLGKAFLPVMQKEGYPKSYGISILIPSAVLSLLIPPSSNMIMFGFIGRISIARCFLSGLIPGLVLMSFLIIVHLIISRKYCPNMKVLPKSKSDIKKKFALIGKVVWKNILSLLIPVIVLGAIYGGIATPTESASIGVIYCLLISVFVYRTIKINELGKIIYDASKLIGNIILLIFFFMVLSRVLIVERVSENILFYLMQVTSNKYGIILLISLLIFFLGMLIDDTSVVIISAILFLPIAKKLGFDPYHFSVITVLLSGAGLITPPVAPLLYLGGHIAGDLPLRSFAVPVSLFIIFAFIPTLLLVIVFPKLATFLPSLIMGG